MIDLDAYCRRIGYDGARTPTLATLRAIHALHPHAIPFENLDPLRGRPVPLDTGALQQKMLREGRGGYCFEQNVLLGHVLQALGFPVRWLMARVRWGVPAGMILPRTHMMLAVETEGESWLVDVGFGGNSLTAPLALSSRDEQPTPHEPFRLVDEGDKIVVQAAIRGAWDSLYAFDLGEQLLPDLETANWFTATHPKSRFRNELVASRVAPGRRYALRNNELAVHAGDMGTERRVLAGVAELRDALTNVFGLTLPPDGDLDAVLARFAGDAQRAAE
jgi:N-hydroxyarylamine O-acetyltransferase